jgi:hypothetical protein
LRLDDRDDFVVNRRRHHAATDDGLNASRVFDLVERSFQIELGEDITRK